MKSSAPAESFEKYADDFPSEVKKRLFALRALVKELAPEATEKISYRMPAYFLNGRLLYFAAHKNHIGFYPMASGIVMIKDKLQDYVVHDILDTLLLVFVRLLYELVEK